MKSDKTYFFLGLMLILTMVSWISSCTHSANIDNVAAVCFERDVLPIFQNSCAISNCHDGSGESYNLNEYVSIRNSVEPYKPYSSPAYKAITATWGENKMPPDQPLTLDNRTIIRLWIEQGAQLAIATCPEKLLKKSGY